MIRIFNLVIALIFIFLFTLVHAELKVTQVQVLFRHGERTPLFHEICPNDIHDASAYLPWGYGQLTNAGKQREFHIGQLLKARYQEKLLGAVFNASEIWAVSSDTERTKMSVQLVLAGLFPPTGEFIWNSDLPWQPIPYYYVPAPLDNLFRINQCPQYVNALAEVRKLPEIQEKVAVYNELFSFLTEKCGRNIASTAKAYEIYNLLVAQKALNLSMPEWYTDEFFEEMKEMTSLEYEITSYTTNLKRLYGGAFVKKFIDNMWLDKDEKNPRKLYLYSGHETTITSFLYAQGISGLRLPHYGTAIMFEKLEDDDGKIFIKVLLWTGVTQELKTLRLNDCEEICPIETYLQLTREVLPSDEILNCHWKRHSAEVLQDLFGNEHLFN